MLIAAKEVKLKNGKYIILKSPVPDDAEKMLSHLKNVFNRYYQNMNHKKNHWDHFAVEDEAKILSDFALSPNKFMITAFNQNEIVGNLGCFGMGGDFLNLNARIGMGLETEFQSIGLGTALLNYAIEQAKLLKFHRLELNVRTFNKTGIRLYEKVGFRQVGILKETALIDEKFYDEYLYELLLK